MDSSRDIPGDRHEPDPDAGEAGIKSIEVGGRLLFAFIDAPEPLGLGELASLANMSASKAHRYLVSFQRLGLVQQDPQTSRYALGGTAIRLGLAATCHSHPQQALQRVQRALRNVTSQTVLLSIWTDNGPVIVRVEEGLSPVVATMKVGTVLPVLATAAGRIFAAMLPWNTVERVLAAECARTPHASGPGVAQAGMEALQSDLEAIRSRGLEHRIDSLLPNISAIAAPFINWRGELIGVLSIIGHCELVDVGFDGAIARELRRATDEFRRQGVL